MLDAWIVLFALWMINGISSSTPTCDPGYVPGFGDKYCGAGFVDIGPGTTAVFLGWCLGFIALSLAWLMTSGRARPHE